MQVNTLLYKRIREYPNQSFTKCQNKLSWQACNAFIDFTRNSTRKRHCGLDQRQAARSNAGSEHKRKLRAWQNPDLVQANVRPVTSARSTWILGNVLAGTNANQCAFSADYYFSRHPTPQYQTHPQFQQMQLVCFSQFNHNPCLHEFIPIANSLKSVEYDVSIKLAVNAFGSMMGVRQSESRSNGLESSAYFSLLRLTHRGKNPTT